MVSDLRKKFVMITTSLMLVIFGAFTVVNHLYNSFWYKSDIADMLELIADSGFFLVNDESGVEQTIKNITEGISPIAGLIVDQEGNVISRKVIGDRQSLEISQPVIERMLKADEYTYQIERYLYSRRKLEGNQTLLVVLDSSLEENTGRKLLGNTIMLALGIFGLILIIIYLSRYVTEPAEKALLREKRFISDAGHELKTPLGAISINAQALKTSNPENLYVKNIVSESERMGRLIERLLTLSRLDEGNGAEKCRVSLSDVVMEMTLTYESVAFEKECACSYDIAEGIFVNGNEDELRQLTAILIDNAIKNAGKEGQIWIVCEKTKEKAELRVINTGEGIEEKDLPHVFERFYTSDESRSNRSFGLGLAIAKAIVTGHKGKIFVQSHPGKETVFTVILQVIE